MAKPTREDDRFGGAGGSSDDPGAPAFSDPPASVKAKAFEQSPPASEPERLPPGEWALRKQMLKPSTAPWLETTMDPIYAAADQAFGWTRDAYNFQSPPHDPFVLSERDYDESLASAGAYPNVPLHEAGFPKRT